MRNRLPAAVADDADLVPVICVARIQKAPLNLAAKNWAAAVFERQQEKRPALTDISRQRIIVKRAACRVKRFLTELYQVDHALNMANGRNTASAESRMRPCLYACKKPDSWQVKAPDDCH